MSRGPGKIERTIEALMTTKPGGAWTVEDLCERANPGLNRVEKKHRVSMLRALHKLVDGDPDWQLWRAGTVGGTLTLVNCANVESYALGRMKADCFEGYRNPDSRQWRRRNEQELRARLTDNRHQELTRAGGSWHRHVHIHIAERDGDGDRLAELKAEHKLVLGKYGL